MLEPFAPCRLCVNLVGIRSHDAMDRFGAKGAVAADGPQTPGRVQINKAMIGCLTHSGYSHGGNGYEGMAFILDQFKAADLKDPTDPGHGLDLKAMATGFAEAYRDEKVESKESGAS